MYKENLDLKNRLGRDAAVQTVLAGVVMRPPAVPYDTLIIDAGTAQGVDAGDFVSAGGTALIGTVLQTYATTARVELFSAPGETYQAMLNGNTPVTIAGQGAGSLIAQVPAGTVVAVGDTVVFPGVAGGISGIVSTVVAREDTSFITLYLHLPVDPLELHYVEVWKNSYAE